MNGQGLYLLPLYRISLQILVIDVVLKNTAFSKAVSPEWNSNEVTEAK